MMEKNNNQQPTTNNSQQLVPGENYQQKKTATKKKRVYSKILRIFVGTKVMDPTVLHLHAGTDAQRYQWPCLRGAWKT